MSASSIRSPRPTSVVSYQTSSPRLPSPLNPSPVSFSPPLPTGHTPRNSPTCEMSDTLSPLRERLDSGFASSPPRSSPTLSRPCTSPFSRTPERSPVMGSVPLQPHRTYARHATPSGSPFVQGISNSSPLSSSPFAGSLQSPVSQNAPPLSPSNSSRPGSPASIHSANSQFQPHLLRSPSHPTQSYLYFPQSSPVQTIPSPPSRYTRTKSLIHQSFGNPFGAQVASSPPDSSRNRRVSLGAESRPHQSTRGSPVLKGDSTPLNEAPVRWWGGRGGWVDDWDNVAHQSHGACDLYASQFSGCGELDDAMGMGIVRPVYGNGSTFREPFGRGGASPGAFLDEEIRASFDGTGTDTGFAESLAPGLVHASMGGNTRYWMDGVPVSRPVPVPMASEGARSRMQNGALGCGEAEVGQSLRDVGSYMQKTPDTLTHCHPCQAHPHGNTSGFMPDCASLVQGQELGRDGRRRRFSDVSTHSSTSYVSCLSGPSQSQSQSLLVSSQSHTSTCPSLCSLGIGIEEAEREGLRSRTIWKRRNSGSTMKRHSKGLSNGASEHGEDVGQGCRCSQLVRDGAKGELTRADGLGPERASEVKAGEVERTNGDSKQLVTRTHEKDTVRHGSSFFRVGSKREDALDEQVQQERYNTAEKYVSLAITSILPATTITTLSPVGEALVKARESAKYASQELAPVLKDTLSVSADLLSLAPLPGLEEAAKALLCVWDACQKVDTNRLSCLRLAERCATLLYSVRCEINEAGMETAMALAEPVEKLCGALLQIKSFLQMQLYRPFLKRYVRREEIARELVACNEAITDAASRFGISVQIRTYHEVSSALNESKRVALEAKAMLSLDYQMMRRQYAMMCGQQVQTWQEVVTRHPSGNALGLTMDDALVSANGRLDGALSEERNNDGGGGYLTPPPAYGPPLPAMTTRFGPGTRQHMPTPSILSTGYSTDGTDSTLSATPTPTRATFVVEETQTMEDTDTKTTATTSMKATAHPTCPMHALAQLHRVQDAVDTTVDEAALRGTMAGALDAKNDVEMVRCLQVTRGEIFEAAETLRRMLGAGAEGEVERNEGIPSEGAARSAERGNTELDRKFMQTGIEAMTRLTRDEGAHVGFDKGAGAAAVPELPSWTITRYEVIRTRKIGMGFISNVYLGHWRKQEVVIKVLARNVSREAFVRYVELWNTLDHPNVLPLYGASSALGAKPWFFVSKFCSGGSLAALLKRAKTEEATMATNEVRVDLLRWMLEIAKGMAYLHGCGMLHGDLRAANVLLDQNGQCVLSDFGQCEIRSDAHQPELRPNRWKAPEMLMGNDQPTQAADVYAFAMCCVEILGMGDLPWGTLDDKVIHDLILDKDERPTIHVPARCAEVAKAVTNLVHSCWVRESDRRPSFASIASSLEEIRKLQDCRSPSIRRASTPVINSGSPPVVSTESSPADEHYETASESMTTEIGEGNMECMMDVSLTSPVPTLGKGDVICSVVHVDTSDQTEFLKILTQVSSGVLEHQNTDTTTPSLTNTLAVDTRHEENYRLIVGSNHAFHNSLTLPLWSPTRVEIGAVGYLSKPKGEFITLFNAIDPLQSCDERLHCLPSMYGYGRFEVQRREDGKRSVAQRGLDAISGFLTFKSRGDRSHPERIARQYAFPLVQGKPSAQLCVEKTVHCFMDHLEAPKTWFKQHVNLILEVLAPRYGIQREDLILVVGTLDAPDWAVFASDDHSDGRAQFNVFSGREKGEQWGMYTVERAVRNGDARPARWVDVGQGTFANKVSCVTPGGHDGVGDTVMLAGLRFERGLETPTAV